LQESFTAEGGFAGFVNAPRRKIWIAAVNGPALAGGCEIVLACDLVVSVRSAVFGLPEVRRGLIASAGGLYRLPRALPKAVALELILTGGTLSAERAHQFGMINRLCDEDVVGAAIELAETISANAPLALVESCRIAREATGFDSEILREKGDAAQDRLSRTVDYREGSRAFIEKRAPKWTGA
jgi:enoyl-CoA hydratase